MREGSLARAQTLPALIASITLNIPITKVVHFASKGVHAPFLSILIQPSIPDTAGCPPSVSRGKEVTPFSIQDDLSIAAQKKELHNIQSSKISTSQHSLA